MAEPLQNTPPVRELYPTIEPYKSGMLEVGDGHALYWEESGNPDGTPVVFNHGGPGGGTSGNDRRYFDPQHYRIVLYDQRGAGKSTPSASLDCNTTWDLVADLERLREYLKISKWVVFGGSWGSTLSLAYAQAHPHTVIALVLRGIFTLRDSEIQWFYQEGASHIFPDYWDGYREAIPTGERNDFVTAYYKRLTGKDDGQRLAAAKAWSTWEVATSRLFPDPETIRKAENDTWALAFARIECHYFVHKGWFSEGQLLAPENLAKIEHIPTTIVQGRYDVVCPATTAWELKSKLPSAKFHMISDAGHSAKERGTTAALVHACDGYRSLK